MCQHARCCYRTLKGGGVGTISKVRLTAMVILLILANYNLRRWSGLSDMNLQSFMKIHPFVYNFWGDKHKYMMRYFRFSLRRIWKLSIWVMSSCNHVVVNISEVRTASIIRAIYFNEIAWCYIPGGCHLNKDIVIAQASTYQCCVKITNQPTNKPTRKLTTGGILRKRKTSSLARLNHSCARSA
jgi:hypothetical protein